jgi:hypothetical protein
MSNSEKAATSFKIVWKSRSGSDQTRRLPQSQLRCATEFPQHRLHVLNVSVCVGPSSADVRQPVMPSKRARLVFYDEGDGGTADRARAERPASALLTASGPEPAPSRPFLRKLLAKVR